MTAKMVMASAKRLMEVRHFCWKSSRIAEISVPAWPMPIHQTKLMMSKAQPTGWLLPHMPMPRAMVTVSPTTSKLVPMAASPTSIFQAWSGAKMGESSSVLSWASVGWPAMSGIGASASRSAAACAGGVMPAPGWGCGSCTR